MTHVNGCDAADLQALAGASMAGKELASVKGVVNRSCDVDAFRDSREASQAFGTVPEQSQQTDASVGMLRHLTAGLVARF